MKVYELLESTSTERIISSLADDLAAVLLKKQANGEFTGERHDLVGTNVGHLSKLVGSKKMGSLYNRLGKVKVEVYNSPASDTAGEARKGQIDLNLHNTNQKKLASFAVHELKHVLDYSYTKNDHAGMVKPHKETNNPEDADKDHDSTTKYHRRKTEINARLSQAFKSTLSAIDKLEGKDVSNKELLDIILSRLTKYELQTIFKSDKQTIMTHAFGRPVPTNAVFHPTDNKYYRKLINRLYKYAKEHINTFDKSN